MKRSRRIRGLFCFELDQPSPSPTYMTPQVAPYRPTSSAEVSIHIPASRRRSRVLLFRPDPGRFDDRPPFFDLSLLLRCESVRCLFVAWPRLLSELNEALMHCRVGQTFDDTTIEFGNDLWWRCFGRPQPMPKGRVKTGHAAFVACRRIGRLCPSRLGHHGVSLDLTRAHLGQRTCHLREDQVDMAGQQILHHRCRPAIRHKLESRPGAFLEIGSDDVAAAADTADTDSGLAGTFLHPGDELLQILRRKARPSHQPHRTICNE